MTKCCLFIFNIFSGSNVRKEQFCHLQYILWWQCQIKFVFGDIDTSAPLGFLLTPSPLRHSCQCQILFANKTSLKTFYSFCSMGQYILILEKCQSWGILDLDLWQCKTSFLFLICFNVVWVALFIFPCTAQISAKYLWFLRQASPPDPPYLPQTAWEDNLYQFVQLPLLALWRVTVRAPTFKKYKTRIHLF